MTQAFGGDGFFKKRITELVKQYNIKSIVETGTYEGWTTRELVKLAPTWTIEAVAEFAAKAGDLASLGIKAFVGSSPQVMDTLLKDKNGPKGPVLFFLDAHGPSYHDPSPLPDELKTIAQNGLKDCVIIIHDFKVPGKDFGFDTYCDVQYTWEWIKPFVELVYGPNGYILEYNTEAEGCKSGIAYILPKFLVYEGISVQEKTIYDNPNPEPVISQNIELSTKTGKYVSKLSSYEEYQNKINKMHFKKD